MALLPPMRPNAYGPNPYEDIDPFTGLPRSEASRAFAASQDGILAQGGAPAPKPVSPKPVSPMSGLNGGMNGADREPLGGATGEWDLSKFRALAPPENGGFGPNPTHPIGMAPIPRQTPDGPRSAPKPNAQPAMTEQQQYEAAMRGYGAMKPAQPGQDYKMATAGYNAIKGDAAQPQQQYNDAMAGYSAMKGAEAQPRPDRGFLQSLSDGFGDAMTGIDQYVRDTPNLLTLGINMMAAANAPSKSEQWKQFAGSFDKFGQANRLDEDRKLAMEDRELRKEDRELALKDREQRLIDEELDRKQLAADRAIFAKEQARKEGYLNSFDTAKAALEAKLQDPNLPQKERAKLQQEYQFMTLGPEQWSQFKVDEFKQEGDYKNQMAQLERTLASQAAAERRAVTAQETALAKQYLSSDLPELKDARATVTNGQVALSAMQRMLDVVLEGRAEVSPILGAADQGLQEFLNSNNRVNYETWSGEAMNAALEALRGTGPVGQQEAENYASALGGPGNTRESARRLITGKMQSLKLRMDAASDALEFHDQSKMGISNPDALSTDGRSFLQFNRDRTEERAATTKAKVVVPASVMDEMVEKFRAAAKKGGQAIAEYQQFAKQNNAHPDDVRAAMRIAGLIT